MAAPGPVLIIEDDEPLRDLLKRLLVEAGHQVCAAPNVEAARERLREQIFPVILLDLDLPRGDALTFLQQGKPQASRILLLTGNASVESAVQALKLGAWDYVPKPFQTCQLCATIDAALGSDSPPGTGTEFTAAGQRPFPSETAERPSSPSTSPTPLRLLVASDDEVVRLGLRQILQQILKKGRFEEASTESRLRDRLCAERWDAVVLDLSLLATDFLERLKQIRNRYPQTPLLVRCATPHPVKLLLEAGVKACLGPRTTGVLWEAALHSVLQGETFLCPEMAGRLAREVHSPPCPLHNTLTAREYQVLCGLTAGRKVSQIARDLALSPKTVQAIRRQVLKKMHCGTNIDLARYAWEHGLLD